MALTKKANNGANDDQVSIEMVKNDISPFSVSLVMFVQEFFIMETGSFGGVRSE